MDLRVQLAEGGGENFPRRRGDGRGARPPPAGGKWIGPQEVLVEADKARGQVRVRLECGRGQVGGRRGADVGRRAPEAGRADRQERREKGGSRGRRGLRGLRFAAGTGAGEEMTPERRRRQLPPGRKWSPECRRPRRQPRSLLPFLIDKPRVPPESADVLDRVRERRP